MYNFLKKGTAVFSVIFLAGCGAHTVNLQNGRTLTGRDYDTSLEVTPISVRFIEAGSTVDALPVNPESDAGGKEEAINKIVIFKVDKILTGEFSMKAGGSSRLDQAKDAVARQDMLALLTFDFKDPDSMEKKKWISVGTSDVYGQFGIQDWENPEPQKMTLYLKRPDKTGGYLLAGVKREKV